MLKTLKDGFLAYHHRTSRGPQGERVVASLSKQLGRVESLLDVGCGDGKNMLALGERWEHRGWLAWTSWFVLPPSSR
jgi:hypothetical protein